MDGSYGLTGGLPPHAGCRTHLALSAQTPEVGSCHGRPCLGLAGVHRAWVGRGQIGLCQQAGVEALWSHSPCDSLKSLLQ